MVEINDIIAHDSGEAKQFTVDEYEKYIADVNAYVLPFETPQKLRIIAEGVLSEIGELSGNLRLAAPDVILPASSGGLKETIAELRERRTVLQNLLLKQNYQQVAKIDEAIAELSSTFLKRTVKGNRLPVELEKWANIVLNILDDATSIKPNTPLGDDNEPTFTAPANVPDIECRYDGFGAICEVTMLTGRNQWYNEGQPVMRHLRAFETGSGEQANYCLFVAPSLHTDTINTFWTAVKYEYEGQKQKIVPITISDLIDILRTVRDIKALGKPFTKEDLRNLYERCADVASVSDSTRWLGHIKQSVKTWGATLTRS